MENIILQLPDMELSSPAVPLITLITELSIVLTIVSISLAIILKKKKISKIFIYVSLFGLCFILSKGIIQGFNMSQSTLFNQHELDTKVYIATIFSYILLLILIKMYKLRRK